MSGPRTAPAPPAGTGGALHTGSGAQYNDAAVHNGRGDQYLFHGDVDVEETSRAAEDLALMRERLPVRSRWLRTVRERFVPPPGPGEEALRERLAEQGCLVLSGEPGRGRGTLAQMLLVPEGDEELGLREVFTEGDGFWYHDDPLPGERLLLDLTKGELDDPRWPVRLRRLVDRVTEAGARIVVTLDSRSEEGLPRELRPHLVRPARPDPRSVLAAHLRAAGLPPPSGTRTERLDTWLDAAGTGEVAELARRAGETLDGGDAGAVAAWIDAVLGAGHRTVDEDLDECDSRARAVLLAVAFLEGAGLEQLSAAAASFLDHTGGPEEETAPIERASFTAELRRLGATVNDRTVRFTDPWRAQVLREVFWDGHLHLQEHVGDWVDHCVAGEGLPEGLREQVARNWAEQALRGRRPEPLLERARTWGTQGHPQAHLLLVEALGDREQGFRARQHLYVWSRERDLPVPLAQILVRVCAEQMVKTHPDQALVRLRHLAGHSSAEVAEEARRRLRALARADPSLFRAQLRALTSAFRDPARRVRDVHVELFTDMTGPDVLDTANPDGRQVVDGLTALLERAPSSLDRVAAPWFTQPEERRRWLVSATQETGHLGELYALALRCPMDSLEPGERDACVHGVRGLLTLIDRAQGLKPGTSREGE